MWLERKILGRLYGEQVCVGLYVCCCLGKKTGSLLLVEPCHRVC